MGDDLEIKLPLRYVIPELVRQQGVARILMEIARVLNVQARRLIWNPNDWDWTGAVDKRYAAKKLEEMERLMARVEELDLARLRDLEEGPTKAMKRWEQEAREELKKYARQSAGRGDESAHGIEETPGGE